MRFVVSNLASCTRAPVRTRLSPQGSQRVNMPPRTIAIGDIHGCSLALERLIDSLDPELDCLVITLGDYVNRGPDSQGVLARLIDLSRRCTLVPLLGNHDQMLLEALATPHETGWLALRGETTLNSSGVRRD